MKANEYDKKLGNILCKKRIELRNINSDQWSIGNIVKQLGWTPVRLMSVESASRSITGHEMVLLCRLYGLDISEVITQVWGEA